MRLTHHLCGIALATLLLADAGLARAEMLDIVATADGVATDNDGDGTFDDLVTNNNQYGLTVRKFDPVYTKEEDRSMIAFDLSAVPTDALIDAVSFRFAVGSFINDSAAVEIFGFQGNGDVSLADATTPAVLLGSYNPELLGLETHSMTLDASAFRGLFAGSSLVTLRLSGLPDVNTQLDSLELARLIDGVPPTLVINYNAVPEPATGLLMALGLVGLGIQARRRAKPSRA